MAVIDGIYRYPVKSLGGQRLARADLLPGQEIAGDRAYAVLHGNTAFDPENPVHIGKIKCLTLMTHPRLARLKADFPDTPSHLVVLRDGKCVLDVSLDEPEGISAFNRFIASFIGDQAKGMPRIVSAPGHMFSDIREPFLSLLNLESIGELAAAAGLSLDPLRFRSNLYVSGLHAWKEKDWQPGDELLLGSARVRVKRPISRCAAVNVDLETARIDSDLPTLLRTRFGQNVMGVYIEVIVPGTIMPGDRVSHHPAEGI